MKNIFIINVFMFFSVLVDAQTVQVLGNVYAFKDLALCNISVKAKKANTLVKTDCNGNFNINCKSSDRLKFSGKGFESELVKINGEKQISVKMIFKGGKRNEILAVLNSHVMKENLLNAIGFYSYYNYYYTEKNEWFPFFHRENMKIFNTSQEAGVGPIFFRNNFIHSYQSNSFQKSERW